jgi:ABC-type transporter Mla subunit MlaD
MANQRNAVRAGIFILLSVAGAIAIVVGITGSAAFTEQFMSRTISFTLADNIGGLRKGDDVRLGGLKVGIVKEIRFVKKDSMGEGKPAADSILVTVSIPTQYPLSTDAKVNVETGLTGVTDINISDLGHGPEMAETDILAGEPDALTAFKASLATLGPKVGVVLDKAHATLDTYDKAGALVSSDVHGLSTDLHGRLKQVGDSAQGALDSIHEMLGTENTPGNFHQAVANVKDMTATLKDRIPALTASSQALLDKLNNSVAKAQGAIDDVKATAANAKDMTAVARSVLVSNQGRLNAIVEGIKKTSDNLDQASVEIRASPWRLLYKPTPDEAANLNLYDAARQFAEGASDLDDAAVALRDGMKDEKADPVKLQKLYDDLQEQFNKFSDAENALWKKVQE